MSASPTARVHPAALAITLFSLAAWGLFVPLRTHHPFHDLDNGTFTDHFSHLNAARIFPRMGLDVWRVPIEKKFRRYTFQELQTLPPQLRYPGTFFVPGWPLDKPLQESWSHVARLYPPGDMLLVAPIALAYHFTSMTTERANLLLILLFLACAHAGLLLALDAALRTDELAAPLGLFAALVLYGELMRWSAAGFYDSACFLPLILCARYLKERRGLAALCAYCVAAVLHFRAFYLAPWSIYAAWLIVRERQWRLWRGRDFLALAATAICAIGSLGAFALLWPTLRALADMNPLAKTPVLLAFWFFWLICAFTFARARAWLDLAVLSWLGFFFPLQHHIFNWYVVLLLPWLAAPVGEAVKERFHWVGEARLVAFIVASGFIYDRTPMPWTWLPQWVLVKG